MPKESTAQKDTVERVMHEFKHGELKGAGGRKVTNPRQAIAIGLSEAGASNQQSPSHTYTAPGTYTVTLTATRTSDGVSDVETKAGYIVVADQPPPGTTRTITPVADAHVEAFVEDAFKRLSVRLVARPVRDQRLVVEE